ncbi:pectin lyase fold/virulence factor [Aspergillus bertholletiae]|uniref:galacturonan 1,4-alpha-galacturonidase n=1 Tax=Aspergillus bertholletiae TaxID=1226010 RepID=A0A5N7B5U4_9EURO|nr:pectin lyase fold/virulence factor [Aspergillus bertholletiae]
MHWLRPPLVAASLLLGLSAIGHASQIDNSICRVKANGNQTNDVPRLLEAFQKCGNGGTIIFPEDQSYWIASRLNPTLNDVTIEWRGKWTFSDDPDYWRKNSYPITLQNHAAGLVITGRNITINGYSTGGIDGNGNAWYTAEAGHTQPGRPMPFVFWNVSGVHALNIMNGTDMQFNNIYCNATAVDAPYGENWVQNTDGFDTMDARNISLINFIYQGGDDCVAIKPRSYDIHIHNVTCRGGNGIAIGSVGQYQEDSSVENLLRYSEDMHGSAYIKTWIGVPTRQDSYESAGLPRGSGWGTVSNIVFSNFEVQGANTGPRIYQSEGNNGSFDGTSLMTVSEITFANFTGYVTNEDEVTLTISCSKKHPCSDIDFDDVVLYPGKNATQPGIGSCKWTTEDGVQGLEGC